MRAALCSEKVLILVLKHPHPWGHWLMACQIQDSCIQLHRVGTKHKDNRGSSINCGALTIFSAHVTVKTNAEGLMTYMGSVLTLLTASASF